MRPNTRSILTHVRRDRLRAARACLVVLCLAVAAAARAQHLPVAAKAEDVGMSGARLDRIAATMEQYVKEGRVAGVVTLVVRQGQVAQFGAYGQRDIESRAAMQKDAIFRIASMTKAITSVAIMMLAEDGKLLISDPISKFIPAFKKTRRPTMRASC